MPQLLTRPSQSLAEPIDSISLRWAKTQPAQQPPGTLQQLLGQCQQTLIPWLQTIRAFPLGPGGAADVSHYRLDLAQQVLVLTPTRQTVRLRQFRGQRQDLAQAIL